MNAASSLLGAVDGIAPVVLVEETVQGVFVASNQVDIMQAQAWKLYGLDNGQTLLRRSRALALSLGFSLSIAALMPLHRSCSFALQGNS